jgi:hypothetical protein
MACNRDIFTYLTDLFLGNWLQNENINTWINKGKSENGTIRGIINEMKND